MVFQAKALVGLTTVADAGDPRHAEMVKGQGLVSRHLMKKYKYGCLEPTAVGVTPVDVRGNPALGQVLKKYTRTHNRWHCEEFCHDTLRDVESFKIALDAQRVIFGNRAEEGSRGCRRDKRDKLAKTAARKFCPVGSIICTTSISSATMPTA